MNHESHLRELFAQYVEGTIDRDHLAALEVALRTDEALRAEFIAYLNVDSALSDLAAFTEVEAAELDSLLHISNPKPILRLRSGLIACTFAVALLAAVILGIVLTRESDPNQIHDGNPPSIARVVHRVDVILTRKSDPVSTDTLIAGSYHLKRGLLHLKFSGNVSVIVEAPAKFEVLDAKNVILDNGRLSATVPPEGIGFTVNTPDAKVVDFGTEFSVDVQSGQSEVHVFTGLVRVHPRTDGQAKPKAVELRATQAARFDKTHSNRSIKLATNRFIRTFEEPRWQYPRKTLRLMPVAYYRMPIRAKGLDCIPDKYSGEIRTGSGKRPPHAPGLIGGSLRILANSIGRGATIQNPPPLDSQRLSIIAWVYANALSGGATVVSNLEPNKGSFALTLDPTGKLCATIRTKNGTLVSCTATRAVPLQTWHQVIVTADGKTLRLYENGTLVAKTKALPMSAGDGAPIGIGASPEGNSFWDGRIDELALFDRALSEKEITNLYQSAQRNEP